jgi:putative transposase
MNRPNTPACAPFDRWYASPDNRKLVRTSGRRWPTQRRSKRLVNPDGNGLRPLPNLELAATGTVAQIKGDGLIKVFKLVTRNGDIE